MKTIPFLTTHLLAAGLICTAFASQAQQHRATFLGNPETRFADPLRTKEDLRDRFRDMELRADIASILHQWGWEGDLDDLCRAAVTSEIREVQLPVGTRMPFMSTRRNGRPVTLKDVLWAGKEPIDAYAFDFTSNERRYRCVVPKPCSNFFVEDPGTPALTLQCEVPEGILPRQTVKACLIVRNSGDGAEPRTVVSLPVPEGATYVSAAGESESAARELKWEIADLGPGEARLLCATFSRQEPGIIPLKWSATGQFASAATSQCSVDVKGIPAILLGVVDLDDPIQLGEPVTYEIRVLNQGNAPGTNIRLSVDLTASQQFLNGSGATEVTHQAGSIETAPLAVLESKADARWTVQVRALEAGDIRFNVRLTSDQFEQPITEQESTRQY